MKITVTSNSNNLQNSSALLCFFGVCVTVLLAAGAKPARPYYATLQAYPCTPSLPLPPFSSLSSPFSPSLTKTYVTRLSPPNTSSLQSPLLPPEARRCEERRGGVGRERERQQTRERKKKGRSSSLEEALRHL